MLRLIAIVLCSSLACAYHPSPTAPSVEPIPVVVFPPPAPPPPLVIALPVITVDISVTPSTPQVGESVTFNVASGNGQAPLSYGWSFGDGTSASGPETTRTHAYSEGVKLIRVVVTDATGRTGQGSREIDVRNAPTRSPSVPPPTPAPPPPPAPPPAPSLSATLTCTPLPHGTPTPCNVNASYGGVLLPSAAITNVDFDWGDGLTNTNGVVLTHTYGNAGSYNIFATVTANTVDGSKSVTISTPVTVP